MPQMFPSGSVFGWLLLSCLVEGHAVGATQKFREGENNYSGSTDAAITTRNLEGTQGNGITIRGEKLPCTVEAGGAIQSRVLLRFADLNLPTGAIVRSAALLISVEAEVGLNLKGSYLLQKWDVEAEALGWAFRDAENRWSEPGASGEGTDLMAGNLFAAGGFVSPGDHTVSIPLDPSVVQRWVREPDSNHGVILSNAVRDEPLLIYSKRHPEAPKRPALEIEWSIPPTVRIIQPAPGAVISGRTTLEAEPSPGTGVGSVQFLVDREPFGPEITETPFRTLLETARLSNGRHTVTVRVRDVEGSAGESAEVVFTSSNALAGPAFFPTPPNSGEIRVRVHPTESIQAGAPRQVTFGVPFPRGALALADLNTIRVLRSGQEAPAYVDLLTPWRHVSHAGLDGKFVRVVRIQISLPLTVTFPMSEEIVVEWGKQARTLNVPNLQPTRLGWHRVTSGSFVTADTVFEPDVFVTLPAAHLAQAGIRPMPMLAFDSAIVEARTDPQIALNANNTGLRAYQEAAKNFFYTIINEDDRRVTVANQCDYKTQYEPWLYDRAAAMYNLYLQSGFLKPLREAVRHSDFFATHLYQPGSVPAEAVGLFQLKVPVASSWQAVENSLIYSVSENLADSYWLTGDDAYLEPIRWVAQAHLTHQPSIRWAPSLRSWTERDAALALNAVTVAYEVFGDAVYRDRMLQILADLRWHQDGADGALPENRIAGGLYHYGDQHDPEEARAGELLASPWMSVLVAAAATRAFSFTEDLGTAEFVRQLGSFLAAAAKRDGRHGYSGFPGEYRYSDYLTYFDGTSHTRSGGEGVQHALDVAAAAGWSYYFSRYMGAPDPGLRALTEELLTTHSIGVRTWTRPTSPQTGLPAYRVSPWRKYAWQYSPSPSVYWALQ